MPNFPLCLPLHIYIHHIYIYICISIMVNQQVCVSMQLSMNEFNNFVLVVFCLFVRKVAFAPLCCSLIFRPILNSSVVDRGTCTEYRTDSVTRSRIPEHDDSMLCTQLTYRIIPILIKLNSYFFSVHFHLNYSLWIRLFHRY